jgi:hypothetical protein
MKTIIVVLLSLLSINGFSQEFKQLHSDYLMYCGTYLGDTTVTQTGTIKKIADVPVYGQCGDIIGYREVSGGDTTWTKVDKVYYRDDYSRGYYSNYLLYDTLVTTRWDGWEYRLNKEVCKPPTRKIKATLQRERASKEGFYLWLWFYLGMLKEASK